MCDTVSDNMADDPWQQVAPGAHSFAVGKAKSMETGEVLYITCNFIDDEWNLHRLVYGAYLVLPPGDHCNAPTLSGRPVVSRDVAGERVVSCILDDDRLNKYYPLMVAGEMTGSIGHLELKRLMDQKLTPDDLDLIFCTTNMDHVLHSIGRCLLPYSNHVNDIFSNVPNSQWATQDCQRLLSELRLDDQLESNENVVADHLLFTLDSQTLLFNLLGAINNAIKRVSASDTPTSNLCLEELLKVRGALQSQLLAPGAAHVALTKALEIVDKAIDGSYLLWSVPLVLDPRYKLRHIEELFPKALDDSKAANYISRVRSMVEELYISYYNDNSNEEMMATDSSGALDQARDNGECHSQDGSHAATKTELDDYLKDSCARTSKSFDFDVLNWWKVYGSVQYPTVAPMARAALAMPTCSKLTSDQIAQVKSLIRGHTKI